MGFKLDKDIVYKFLEPFRYSILLSIVLFIPASFLYPIPTHAGLPQFIAELLAPYYSQCIKCSPHVSTSALNLVSSYISASILEFVNTEYNLIDYEELRNSLMPLGSYTRISVQILIAIFLVTTLPSLGLPLSYYESSSVACGALNCGEPKTPQHKLVVPYTEYPSLVYFIGITYLKIIKHTEQS
jgi:hypothetical protein